MKLSTRARYALRMMVEIARDTTPSCETVSLSDVADRTNISRRYLEQLAIALKNSGLIRGKTGRGGGYRLGRPAEEITAAEIISAVIGPISIVDCVLEPDTCVMADNCSCRGLYCTVNERIVKTLNDLTLEDLTKTH